MINLNSIFQYIFTYLFIYSKKQVERSFFLILFCLKIWRLQNLNFKDHISFLYDLEFYNRHDFFFIDNDGNREIQAILLNGSS